MIWGSNQFHMKIGNLEFFSTIVERGFYHDYDDWLELLFVLFESLKSIPNTILFSISEHWILRQRCWNICWNRTGCPRHIGSNFWIQAIQRQQVQK